MVESQVTSLTPATHADRHKTTGADPLVAPLLAHHTQHEAGGADEIAELPKAASLILLNGATINNTWTDIDISGEIGANVTFVMLEVHNLSANPSHFGFRPNGNTHGHYCAAGSLFGMNKCDLAANGGNTDSALVGVITSAAGIIEYNGNGQNALITMLGYIQLG